MNWMLIIVLAVLLLAVLWGAKKGLIRVLYSMVVGVIILFALGALTPKATELVKSTTKLDESLTAAYETTIQKIVDEKAKESNTSSDSIKDLEDLGIHIPQFVIDKVDETKDKAVEGASNAAAESGLYAKLATVLADYTVTGIVMLVLGFFLIIIYFIVERLLNLISKLPVINQANVVAGAILGLVDGLLFVWIAFGIITLFSGTPAGIVCNEQIQNSKLLVWLFDHNLLLKLVLLFF